MAKALATIKAEWGGPSERIDIGKSGEEVGPGTIRKAFSDAGSRGGGIHIRVSRLLNAQEKANALALLAEMNSNGVSVILEGLPAEIVRLEKAAPDLAELFSEKIDFHPLTSEQLAVLFERRCKDEKFKVPEKTRNAVIAMLNRVVRDDRFNNAHFLDRCLESWTDAMAGRLARIGKISDLKTLLPEDIVPPRGAQISGEDGSKYATAEALVDALGVRVEGQDEAKLAVAQAVVLRRGSMVETSLTQKPVGSHLFVGPSGVGKSYLGRVVADLAYGGRLIRTPGSELTERHDAMAMIRGASAGYVGHDKGSPIPDQIRAFGGSCVWQIDEADKCDPVLWDILMEILDTGKFIDNEGNEVDCRNVHIILTSNYGNDVGLFNDVPDGVYDDVDGVRQRVMDLLHERLRPEQLGRLSDDPLLFHPLSSAQQTKIFDRQLQELVGAQVAHRGFTVVADGSARALLVERGYRPDLGNRPLERLLGKQVLLPLIERFAADPDQFGEPPGIIRIGVAENELTFTGERRTEAATVEHDLEAELARLEVENSFPSVASRLHRAMQKDPPDKTLTAQLAGDAANLVRSFVTAFGADPRPHYRWAARMAQTLERKDLSKPSVADWFCQIAQTMMDTEPDSLESVLDLVRTQTRSALKHKQFSEDNERSHLASVAMCAVLVDETRPDLLAGMVGAAPWTERAFTEPVLDLAPATGTDHSLRTTVLEADGLRSRVVAAAIQRRQAETISDEVTAMVDAWIAGVSREEWGLAEVAWCGETSFGEDDARLLALSQLASLAYADQNDRPRAVRDALSALPTEPIVIGDLTAEQVELELVKNGTTLTLDAATPNGAVLWFDLVTEEGNVLGAYRFDIVARSTPWRPTNWTSTGFDLLPKGVEFRLRGIYSGTHLRSNDTSTCLRLAIDFKNIEDDAS